MLINCTNVEDSGDVFVINPPAVLPLNSLIVYHKKEYIVTNILYDDENGVIDYSVSLIGEDRNSVNFMEKALWYCRNKQKLQAVKLIKEKMNLGLKDAKDYVDNLCKKHGIQ